MWRFWLEHSQALKQVGWDVQVFSDKLLPVVADADVLEVGCGAGALSLRLAVRARAVTGIDFTAALIETALQAAADCPFRNRLRFLERDILDLELGEKFDLI